MKKIVNLILGAFLLCSSIIPIIGLSSAFTQEFSLDNTSEKSNLSTVTQEDYEEMVLNETADNLVSAANEILLNEGIKAENIKIGIKKTDEGSIYISKIIIYISNEDISKANAISKIITLNFSKEPIVTVYE